MKRKNVLAIVLAAALSAGMLTGCGESQVSNDTAAVKESQAAEKAAEEEAWDGTYPVETDVELSFYTSQRGLMKSSAYVDFNDVPFYKGLSEQTGIAIDWQTIAEGADPQVAYNLLLQEKELPSIIWGDYGASPSLAEELYESGLIYDLTEYLPVYAPDYWKWLNEDEANMAAAKTEDGKILAFYFVRESDFNITYIGPIVRQDWLDECGLDTPVTLEDWENVLRAFKDKYGAQLSFTSDFSKKFGLANGTGAFTSLILGYYVEDGQIKCANTQDEWKDYLEVLHRWYAEGLISPDFVTEDYTTLRAKVLNNEVGITFGPMSQLTIYISDAEAENTGAQWGGLSYPRTEAGAATTAVQTDSQLLYNKAGAVITTSCTEEELIAALKFLNYGYSEEGSMYWNFGVEGETYTVDADGNVQFTELLTEDPRGLGEVLMDYTGTYSSAPALQLADFVKLKNNPASVKAVEIWTENTVAGEYICPPYQRTTQEQELYSDIDTQMSTYVSEMALKFVTGDESLDNFDKFVEQLELFGLDKLLESEQAAYERYID